MPVNRLPIDIVALLEKLRNQFDMYEYQHRNKVPQTPDTARKAEVNRELKLEIDAVLRRYGY